MEKKKNFFGLVKVAVQVSMLQFLISLLLRIFVVVNRKKRY